MVHPVSMGPVMPVRSRMERQVETGASRQEPVDAAGTTTPALPKLLRLAKELAEGPPPVDSARIAEIREAIATGRYRPDAERIIDSVVAWFTGATK